MKRTTISLSDDLCTLLERESQRCGTSMSEITRRALASYFGVSDGKRKIAFAALGESGHRHTARDMEEILAKEWGNARRR